MGDSMKIKKSRLGFQQSNHNLNEGKILGFTTGSSLLDSFFPYIPYFVILILLFEGLVGQGYIANDPMRLSWYVISVVELIIHNDISSKAKDVFSNLYSREAVTPISRVGRSTSFEKFQTLFENLLTSRYALISGGLLLVAIFVATYPMMYWVVNGNPFFNGINEWFYFLINKLVIIDVLIAFPVGVAFWRFVIVAIFISRLCKQYRLKVQFSHPDKCGGLKEIGDICLLNALVFLVPAIFLSCLIVLARIPGIELLKLWEEYFKKGLLVLTSLSFFLFFQPILLVHIQMKRQLKEIKCELEKISLEIEKANSRLRKEFSNISGEDIEKDINKIEQLKKIYIENVNFPTWPFNLSLLLKLFSSSVIPLMTLLGTTEPLIKLFEAVNALINM